MSKKEEEIDVYLRLRGKDVPMFLEILEDLDTDDRVEGTRIALRKFHKLYVQPRKKESKAT